MAIFVAALAYFRPKPWLVREIDERLRRSVPSDLNPDRTIGVPIRRGHKCIGHSVQGSAAGELECPPLSTYLDAVQSIIRFDPLIENVIVTSEDKNACNGLLQLLKKEVPDLRIVLNVGDVQQGTGSGSKLEQYEEGANNADVIASALTSMHMHLRARYFVVTTKSTFVVDIGKNTNDFGSFARTGCGNNFD